MYRNPTGSQYQPKLLRVPEIPVVSNPEILDAQAVSTVGMMVTEFSKTALLITTNSLVVSTSRRSKKPSRPIGKYPHTARQMPTARRLMLR